MSSMITFIKKRMRLRPKTTASKIFFDTVSIPVFVFFFLLSFNGANAQVSVYNFSESLSGYTPLSGTPTVAFAAPWNNNAPVAATIPFNFNFNGVDYTTCRISPNGFITFGTTVPGGAIITPLSNNGLYTGAVSALGMDLVSNGQPIVYGTEGTAPNRVFVIQWADAVRGVIPGNYNFQIRLHETSNIIDFSYGPCSSTSDIPVTSQVGLRGPNTNMAAGSVINRSMAANQVWYNNTVPGTANNSFVRTVDLAYPDLGLRYRWTPAPPCTTP